MLKAGYVSMALQFLDQGFEMSERKKKHSVKNTGRGRLSKIDMLPDEANDAILWLNEQLRERRMTQVEIRDQFNSMLCDLKISKISKGAFSRYSNSKAAVFKEIEETHSLALELAQSMGMDSAAKSTQAIAQMTRSASLKLLEKGKLTPQDIVYLTKSLKEAAAAEKISVELRIEIEKETLAKAAKEASKSAKKAGVSDEALKIIERDVLGLA